MNFKESGEIGVRVLFFGLVIITILLSCSTNEKDPVQALKVTESLKDTLRMILQEGQLTTEKVGYELESSQQYYRVAWVIENASSSDLESLVESSNGILNAIGFMGLYKKQEANWYQHLLNIMADTTTYLHYMERDLGETMKVSEFCLRKVIQYEILDSSSLIFNLDQRKEINNLIAEHNLDIRIRE